MARWVRSAGSSIVLFKRTSTPDIVDDITVGDLWSDTSLNPPILKKCTNLSPVTWVSTEGSGGGGGESNTASNVGTAGVGIWKQKTGVDLEFKKINAGSSKITITDDTGNDEVDIDVAQANLDHGSIGGLADDDHTQYHNDSRANTWLATKTTANLTENTNLYFTDERAQDAVGSMIDASLTYVDGTPLLQRAALTGDVTASAGSNSTTIATAAVSLAKMADMATSSLIYRKTAGSGAPEVNTLATLKTDLGLTGTNSGDQNLFSTIAVSGQSNVVADAASDTLTLVAGTNVTITTDASTDSITINSSGGGGGNSFQTISVSGQSDVVADSSTDTLTLVAGSNITITTDASTDSITITGSGGGSGLTQPQVMAISSMGL